MSRVLTLRVHHLLCIPLYTGHGYSEEFAEHMSGQVERLRSGVSVKLTTGPDIICSACPNLSRDKKSCCLDLDHVKSKDEALLTALRLSTEQIYESRALWEMVRENMTREIFETSCRNCDWYKQGYCNYTNYQKGIRSFL